MKKLLFVLLVIVAVSCITTKHDRPCHYKVEYDGKIDTIWTDRIEILTGGIGDQTDTYTFYVGDEKVARVSGKSVMLKKLD